MTNLSPEICRKIKNARREAKLGQIEVAAEVGCKQSALSMFENGDGTKLNDEVINKLLKKFGISLDEEKKVQEQVAVRVETPGVHGYCQNPHCPSNHSYEVDGRSFLRPDRQLADPVCAKFCAVCGEVLEKTCRNCGAPVHDGAICSFCGEPYVIV